MRVKCKVIAKQPEDNGYSLATKKLNIQEKVKVFSTKAKTDINMNNYYCEINIQC